MQTEVELTAISGLSAIAAQDWDACACPEAAEGGRAFDPFTTYRFL
ncbi:GNAT family N-acetyltransferase, partial [Escherichia coli]|nr:GNAT family N-acetyltransferase [Escherichia coli]